MSDLDKTFKAYGIRGVVPGQFGEDVAEAVGAAIAEMAALRDEVLGVARGTTDRSEERNADR